MAERAHSAARRSAAAPTAPLGWGTRILGAVFGRPERADGRSSVLRYGACRKCADSVGVVGVVCSAFLMVIKGFLGVVGNSTALIADAIHSSADLISALMLLIGLRVARRPADNNYPYGYGKVEFIISVIIYSALIGAGVVIVVDAVSAIVHAEHVEPSGVTLLGAAIAIVVNELMYRQSYCAGKQLKSPSLVANAHEKRSDAFTSIAVFAGIAGAKAGLPYLDPMAALLVGVYIFRLSIKMLIEAFKGLLDTALDDETVAGIRKATEAIASVRGIEAVRTREIGQQVWVDLEIYVDGGESVGEVARTRDAVQRAVAAEIGREARIEVYARPLEAQAEPARVGR